MVVFNDIMTSDKLDNIYYQNLVKGLGLLKSDQDLLNDTRMVSIVAKYTKDQNIFFNDFATTMEKLGLYEVKTKTMGDQGKEEERGTGVVINFDGYIN